MAINLERFIKAKRFDTNSFVLDDPTDKVKVNVSPGSDVANAVAAGQRAISTIAQAQGWTDNTTDLTPLRLADAFKGGNASLSANGYQKLPSGLIIQWGVVGCPENYVANTRFAFNLPIAFPSSALCIILSNSGTNNVTTGTQAVFISTGQAEVVWGQNSANAYGLAASYVAFGF